MKISIGCFLSIATATFGCSGRSNPVPSASIAAISNPNVLPITTIVSPTSHDGKALLPVIVTMHGMGSAPSDFLGNDWQGISDQLKVHIVAVSGPFAEGPNRFAWSDDTAENHSRIQNAVVELGKKTPFKTDRLYLMGYSQGAYAALSVGISFPKTIAGVIAISPGSLTNPSLPDEVQPLTNRGFVLCFGERDEADWIKQGRYRINHAMSRGGKTIVKSYPNEGHLIPSDLDELLPKWLAFLERTVEGKS